jgi:hypothetical protein
MPKCKNCGFCPPSKPKKDYKKDRQELLINLFTHFDIGEYSGNIDLQEIWDDFKHKMKSYNGSNSVSVRAVINKIDKTPDKKIIDLIMILK